jgi:tetratricopeptide (TPR) repeat protein
MFNINSLKVFGIFLLVLFLNTTQKTNAQWTIMKSDADSLVTRGSDYIYDIKFDSARYCFNKVIEMYPEHPAGHFLDAMLEFWKISIFRNTTQYNETFLTKIDKVINLCDLLLDRNSSDLSALFFKGGALGYRARFYSNNTEWLKAAYDGKEAYNIMQRCLVKAPGNHDIMLGTGIYNYFADAIPEKYPLVKPLLTFMQSGDKKIGILQLKSSALYARYTEVEAKVTLMQLFYSFENNMNEALYYSKMLFDKYPNNPYFHRYVGRVYVRMGEWDSLEVTWRSLVNRSLDKWTGYDNHAAKEGCYYVGLALQRKGEYEKALKYLLKCDEIARASEKETSGFRTSALLKIGIIYDQQNNRKKAVEFYKKVLELKDIEGSHEKANNYLKNPYK